MFDEKSVSLTCTQCSQQITKTIGWLKQNPDFACDCGQSFEAHKLIRRLEQGEKSVGKFVAGLRKRGK
ncbi:hypothetical protein [Sphingomonas sp. NPDC049708]|uniref:hypothetical protein n=1 Tax=Sphingomonas sp. NPDC049708 TaxID=3390681 RepID=UPI003CFEE85E